ncbi:hypothetical protein Pelo_10458 [Pelomyxa schiedti]|nr:hypothetical protein Pelo_10458 [Pelomyxa schiedti]
MNRYYTPPRAPANVRKAQPRARLLVQPSCVLRANQRPSTDVKSDTWWAKLCNESPRTAYGEQQRMWKIRALVVGVPELREGLDNACQILHKSYVPTPAPKIAKGNAPATPNSAGVVLFLTNLRTGLEQFSTEVELLGKVVYLHKNTNRLYPWFMYTRNLLRVAGLMPPVSKIALGVMKNVLPNCAGTLRGDNPRLPLILGALHAINIAYSTTTFFTCTCYSVVEVMSRQSSPTTGWTSVALCAVARLHALAESATAALARAWHFIMGALRSSCLGQRTPAFMRKLPLTLNPSVFDWQVAIDQRLLRFSIIFTHKLLQRIQKEGTISSPHTQLAGKKRAKHQSSINDQQGNTKQKVKKPKIGTQQNASKS